MQSRVEPGSQAGSSSPRVSIIMPTYNVEPYVERAVQSVRQQSLPDWELLVADDASDDGTMTILERYAALDPRIHILPSKERHGAAVTRNRSLERARGRFIAFLDSDDFWLPEKLDRQLAFMEKTGAALSYTGYEKVSAGGEREGRIISVPATVSYQELLNNTLIATVTAIYDTQQLGKVPMPAIQRRQDFALWLMILRQCGLAHGLNEPLACLRKRPGSLSSNRAESARYVWRVYRHHEHLSRLRSSWHFANYAIRAALKAGR